MKKKTVRLWKWPKVKGCIGCFFTKDGKCSYPEQYPACIDSIFKQEKPEPEFVDIEIETDE